MKQLLNLKQFAAAAAVQSTAVFGPGCAGVEVKLLF